MSAPLIPINPVAPPRLDVVQVTDPAEMGADSRLSQRLPGKRDVLSYHLMDRGLLRERFQNPIATMSIHPLGGISIGLGSDRFATQVGFRGDWFDAYLFSMMLRGSARLVQNGNETTMTGAEGGAFRATSGTQISFSDSNVHRNLWIDARTLEQALEHMLDDRLRSPLRFTPRVDWAGGIAASLRWQIDFLLQEVERSGGVLDSRVMLASVTDLILSLVVRGLPNNYSERLENDRCFAAPKYVRRAEDFMRANVAVPLRMEQIALAAGCSVRTLGAVFRRFRDTSPLGALHAIRLDEVRAEFVLGGTDAAIPKIARRFGFTNSGRFNAAYCRRFGESPRETIRRRIR